MMKKIQDVIQKKCSKRILFVLGLLFVLLLQIPYLILGEDSIIPYHDQLDGELIAYIYQAKYLGTGIQVIPEFLNGASKTALWPPAPLAVLLFRVLTPLTAYLVMQCFGQVVAFAGMFWLVDEMKATCMVKTEGMIPFLVGVMYTLLPFLPVYGLSQYGMPMLLLSAFYLYQEKNIKRSILYIVLYGTMSSLVLCGFVWIALGAFVILFLLIKRELLQHKSFLVGWVTLLVVYILENTMLLFQTLGIGDAVLSHKSEYALNAEGFFGLFWRYFCYNGEHSMDSHLWIAVFAGITFLVLYIFLRHCERPIGLLRRYFVGVFFTLVAISVFAAFWDSTLLVPLRNRLGALGAFQVNRVLWIAPLMWYLLLGIIMMIGQELLRGKTKAIDRINKGICYTVFFGVLGVAFLILMKQSLVKPCIQKIINSEYQQMSYSDYFAIGVLDQVEEFLEQKEGLTKEEYKVASLGIDPAAALYHGFFCVDGYSNNYSLEYKHAFRDVIAPELEKSDYLKTYYDDWGNRCYLFSAECPGYYTVEKNGFFYQDLSIDTNALKNIGCDYIFSAAWIDNAENVNLHLVHETPFETEESYYRIFVYEIIEN